MALELIMAIGLARSRPAMSGAEPCAAWAMARSWEALIDGAMPSDPAISPARSDRMSPIMFSVTSTSKSAERRTRCTVMASMWKSSTVTSGYPLAISRQTSRNRPVVSLSTLALWTIVRCRRRRLARSRATRAIRSTAGRVTMPRAMATSGEGMNSPVPA
jgi:hypothetical protein